ncbi:hypothetical protein ATCC90586_007074 [Pythium insidiosum]|nr:hypothetical protein ATCC90586_007074 [Pythium insidiosum]
MVASQLSTIGVGGGLSMPTISTSSSELLRLGRLLLLLVLMLVLVLLPRLKSMTGKKYKFEPQSHLQFQLGPGVGFVRLRVQGQEVQVRASVASPVPARPGRSSRIARGGGRQSAHYPSTSSSFSFVSPDTKADFRGNAGAAEAEATATATDLDLDCNVVDPVIYPDFDPDFDPDIVAVAISRIPTRTTTRTRKDRDAADADADAQAKRVPQFRIGPMKSKWTNEGKLSYIKEAQQTSIRAVARRIGIDRKTVRQWVVKEKEVAETAPRGYRAVGAGRKLLTEELEFLLYWQINEERGERRRVTRNLIELWAKELAQELGIEDFTAFNGWVDGFLSRHNLVMRKATNKTNLDEAQIVQRAVDFVRHVRKLIDDHGVTEDTIFNMDETAVFPHQLDESTTEKHVVFVLDASYGFEKNRITAICCASADGKKKPPTLILQGTKSEMVLSNGVAYAHIKKSWMNSDFFIEWVDFMFPLVMPWKTLLRRKILYAVIPGGMTAYLQPADHSRFKPFKDVVVTKIDEWKRAGKFEYTWWQPYKAVSEALVKKSFQRCFLGASAMGCEPSVGDEDDYVDFDGSDIEDSEEFIAFLDDLSI